MHDHGPETTAPTPPSPPSADRPGRYTGVVVIHGLGAIMRNTTLEEAVNTLAYWFNHEAGLDLRREGPGRVWVQAELTDDPNPDARAARAWMHLAAPGASAAPADPDTELQLEFREVWWAESFGLPSVGATLAWARVQAWEQATHLLLPIGRRLGPARAAARTPARAIPQAVTYRPALSDTDAMPPRAHAAGLEDTTTLLARPARLLLTGALGCYSLVQYVWKALQWLILTPLVLLLLLAIGLIRLLALLPPLRSTIVASLSAVLNAIMLHWVAEAQVYTQDYTRSAGIRERFEREARDFLRDDRCDRLVVIAHSMGTVIAYEGLTTVLDHPEFRESQKPVTFVCLAQALRRVWLMTPDDPHRLRGVLPDRVRWLHFWARYDPVAAGPLSFRSLIQIDNRPDLTVPNPHDALGARLDRCENVDVVNTDSAFTDHTTYWENLEQVVGPIARELVAGHPVLEQAVQAHLATPDEVLLRRWRVAWRSTVALIGGIGLGAALVVWDGSNGWSRVGHTLATSFLHFLWDLVGGVAGPFVQAVNDLMVIVGGLAGAGSGGRGPTLQALPVTIPTSAVNVIWSVGAGLVVAGGGILAIGRGIALRSPVEFHRTAPARGGVRGILALSGAAFVLLSLAYGLALIETGIVARYPGFSESLGDTLIWIGFQVATPLTLLSGATAVVRALISAARSRRWGWAWAILLPSLLVLLQLLGRELGLPLILLFQEPSYANAFPVASLTNIALSGLLIAAVGSFQSVRDLARNRRFGGVIAMALVAVALAATLLLVLVFMYVYDVAWFSASAGGVSIDAIPVIGLFALTFVYGLSGAFPGKAAGIGRRRPRGDTSFVALAAFSLVLLAVPGLGWVAFVGGARLIGVSYVRSSLFFVAWYIGLVIGLVALGCAVTHAVRHHRWGWLGAMGLVVVLMPFAVVWDSISNVRYDSGGVLQIVGDMLGVMGGYPYLILAFALALSAAVAALVYGLWSGPALLKRGQAEAHGLSSGAEHLP